MTRSRLVHFMALLLLAACESAGPDALQRHLEGLCAQQQVREEYLDFYWDDLRSHQPKLWQKAFRTCTDSCPDAVNCGPVLSVASWYAHTPLTAHP